MKKSNFPQNLKVLRKQYSMSMEELGNHINVSKQTISKYEKGLMEPNFHTLVSISSVFDCSLDDLVFGNIGQNDSIPSLFVLKDLINTEFSNLENELHKISNNLNSEIKDTKSQIFDSIKSLYEYELNKLKD